MSRIGNIDKLIGHRVIKLRIARGLTRDDVVKELGISSQQLSKYEFGTNRISIGRLLDIAKILKCEPSCFYEECISSSNYQETNPYALKLNIELAKHLEEIANSNIQEAILTLTKSISKEFKVLRGY